MRAVLVVLMFGLLSACGGGDGGDGGGKTFDVSIKGTTEPVSAGSSIYLNFTTNGAIYEVIWEVVTRPPSSLANVVKGTNAAPYDARITPDRAGEWRIRLTITDGSGGRGSDEFTFTATNEPPTAFVWPLPKHGSYPWLVGETAEFSAQHAGDPNNDPLSYEWELVGTPAASNTELSDASAEVVSLLPDVAGDYVIRLTVADYEFDDSTDYTFTVAENTPPQPFIAQLPALLAQETVTLDGSRSIDMEVRPLTYTWQITDAPTGSAAVLSSDGAQATLSPDGPGPYEVQLTVNDGVLEASRIFKIVTMSVVTTLAEIVVDAEYHATNGALVMALADGTLSFMALDSGTMTSLSLPFAPTALSISPDGSEIVVGHNAAVSLVDVSSMKVVAQYASSVNVGDIVHGGNGYAYVVPYYGQHVPVQSVELLTGNWTNSVGTIYGRYGIRKQPDNTVLYGSNDGGTDLIKSFDISGATATFGHQHIATTVDDGGCGGIWFTELGDRMITACGAIFDPPVLAEDPPVYLESLEENRNVRFYPDFQRKLDSVGHVKDLGEIAAIETVEAFPPGNESTTIRRYDAMDHRLLEEVGVPGWREAGGVYEMLPRYVVQQRDTGQLVIVMDIIGLTGKKTAILRY